MQRPTFTNTHSNNYLREAIHHNNQFYHLPRLIMQGPQIPHPSKPLICTSQPQMMDHPLQSWLDMGLQVYALIFTVELNKQEVVLLVQNPTHLAEIITEGIRFGMEAYVQTQWYTTQTPLLLDHRLAPTTMVVSHEPSNSACKPTHEPASFLPSTPLGPNICPLVPTT